MGRGEGEQMGTFSVNTERPEVTGLVLQEGKQRLGENGGL